MSFMLELIKGSNWPYWLSEIHFQSHFWTFQMDRHLESPKFTFDRISGHFRLIRNFFVGEIFDKMAAGNHFGWDNNVNYRSHPRYLDEQCMC